MRPFNVDPRTLVVVFWTDAAFCLDENPEVKHTATFGWLIVNDGKVVTVAGERLSTDDGGDTFRGFTTIPIESISSIATATILT